MLQAPKTTHSFLKALKLCPLKNLVLFLGVFICTQSFAKNTLLQLEAQPYIFAEEGEANGFAKLNIKHRKKVSRKFFYHIRTEFIYSNLKNSSDKSYFFNPNGTRVIYKVPSASTVFALGFNPHLYKISKLFSPMDYIDQTNYWDPLNPSRFSDFSLRTSFKTGEVVWHLTYIPYRMKPVYPGKKSYWLPRQVPNSIEDGEGRTIYFPEDPTYEWKDTEVYDDSNKHNISLMADYKTKNWLWRWGYYNGLDVQPNFHLELNLQNLSFETFETQYPIFIIPVQNKVQKASFGFRYTTPIKWRIIFENSINFGDKSALVAEDYLYSSTLALEWGIPVGNDILYGMFQGFYSLSSEPKNSLGVVPPLRQAALAALLWKKPTYELSLAYIYSFSIDIALTQASTKIFFNDNFYTKASANFFNGSVPEIISGIKNNDIFYLNLGYKYTF